MKQAVFVILLAFSLLDYLLFQSGIYIAVAFGAAMFLQGDSSAYRVALQRNDSLHSTSGAPEPDALFEEFLETEPLKRKKDSREFSGRESTQEFHLQDLVLEKTTLCSEGHTKKKATPQLQIDCQHRPKFSGKPHEVLVVAENASTKMILGAFRNWIKVYHPDTAGRRIANANDKSRQLNDAKVFLLKKRRQGKNPTA